MILRVEAYRGKCCCCPRTTTVFTTRASLLFHLRLRGWCLDYEGLELVICRQCHEVGKVPNVDEELRLTISDPDVTPHIVRIAE